jgi:hypothetical protein
MTHESVGEEYVRLALAIDQHLPGYVDAYFGPPAWQEQAKTDGPRPLPELAQQASRLAIAIANADTLDHQRQEFLARHVLAMQTSLRLLQGERMVLADEVEALYDVRPNWVEEALFEEAHRLLDDLLPSGHTLRERMALRKQALEISVKQVKQVLPLIQQQLRQLSRERFPLPEEEALDFTFVQNQPWMAYNWYLGRYRSRIEINTDLPLHINGLADLVAHEAYPGHHTELSIKESQLVQQAGHVEHSLTLLNAPSCVVSEGLATCALTTILSDEAWVTWHAEEIFPRAGLKHVDAQREQMIDQALEHLDGVGGNAAFLLHEQGAAAETVGNYLQHYGLLTEQEAHKRIEFLSSPLDRSYIFTYYWGKSMLKALFALKQERPYWYTRLLTEAVTPTQIRQWLLE